MIKTHKMTEGSPSRLILNFALPLMLGNVFQQFYTFADTVIVGRALGVGGLAALGATEWLIFLMNGALQGMVHGFSVVIAQAFGRKDETTLRKSVVGAVYLTAAGIVLFTVTGQLMAGPVLRLMKTPGEVMDMAELYLRIIYAGIPVAFAYNLMAAILRAVGNSRAPLKAVTLSSLCNVALDILFVFGFHWGVAGAAISTVLAEGISAVYCLIVLGKIAELKPSAGELRPDRKILLRQMKLGIPMGLQNTITAVGGLIVQSVINGFGVLFIAGYTAANKLYGLLETAASSYGYTMSTFAAQNMGAGLKERIRQGLKSANLISAGTALCMSAIMVFLGKPILLCFITGEEAVRMGALQAGYQFLLLLAVFFPLLYVLYTTRGCVQGMGNAVLPMASSMAQLTMRVGCALFLTALIGERGVYWGEVLAWAAADVILMIGYYRSLRPLSSATDKKGGRCGKA